LTSLIASCRVAPFSVTVCQKFAAEAAMFWQMQ
jgi:hypothetical protein